MYCKLCEILQNVILHHWYSIVRRNLNNSIHFKEDALNLPCINILSEVNSPIIFIETKMLKSVQKDFVSINLIGWCTQCYCLVGIKFITGWNKMWCCNILWRILMQFFATKTSTKVLSHHPDYNDVLIFHIGIECASCARPQASDLNCTNKGFSLYQKRTILMFLW